MTEQSYPSFWSSLFLSAFPQLSLVSDSDSIGLKCDCIDLDWPLRTNVISALGLCGEAGDEGRLHMDRWEKLQTRFHGKSFEALHCIAHSSKV